MCRAGIIALVGLSSLPVAASEKGEGPSASASDTQSVVVQLRDGRRWFGQVDNSQTNRQRLVVVTRAGSVTLRRSARWTDVRQLAKQSAPQKLGRAADTAANHPWSDAELAHWLLGFRDRKDAEAPRE